jgi:hypothetical protein
MDSSFNVALHIRPLLRAEVQGRRCLEVSADNLGTVTLTSRRGTSQSYTYNRVFGENATAKSFLYQTCVEPLVQSLFRGYNATVLAYGQTGSGKNTS